MMTLIGLGYYLLAGLCLAVIGALAHLILAKVNMYPDRLTDKPWLDMAISDGYDAQDRLLGTEYDEYGFYRFDSRRNLTIAVLSTLAVGWVSMLLSTDIALTFANGANTAGIWLWKLFQLRLSQIEL